MRSLIADLVLVRLQKETDPLLHKRLYKAIRHAILDGSLPPDPVTGAGGYGALKNRPESSDEPRYISVYAAADLSPPAI